MVTRWTRGAGGPAPGPVYRDGVQGAPDGDSRVEQDGGRHPENVSTLYVLKRSSGSQRLRPRHGNPLRASRAAAPSAPETIDGRLRGAGVLHG